MDDVPSGRRNASAHGGKIKTKSGATLRFLFFGGTSVLYGGHDFDLGMIIDGQRFFILQR